MSAEVMLTDVPAGITQVLPSAEQKCMSECGEMRGSPFADAVVEPEDPLKLLPSTVRSQRGYTHSQARSLSPGQRERETHQVRQCLELCALGKTIRILYSRG